MVVRSQREESRRPHAAMLAAGQVAEALQERGIKEVHVKLRGAGGKREVLQDLELKLQSEP